VRATDGPNQGNRMEPAKSAVNRKYHERLSSFRHGLLAPSMGLVPPLQSRRSLKISPFGSRHARPNSLPANLCRTNPCSTRGGLVWQSMRELGPSVVAIILMGTTIHEPLQRNRAIRRLPARRRAARVQKYFCKSIPV
jgi:hypothetical protein